MPESFIQFLKRHKEKALLVGAGLVILDISLLAGIAGFIGGNTALSLSFLDVGQGDAEYMVLPSGVRVLVDGGPPGTASLSALAKLASQNDRYIDLVAMTHPQTDHIGGLIEVLKRYDVGAFLWPGRTNDIPAFRELMRVARERNVRTIELGEGDAIWTGADRIAVLSPGRAFLASKDTNDSTLVLLLESAGIRVLFAGDIGSEVERMLARAHPGTVDILKVPHHGSRFSSTQLFLDAVRPLLAVIEVGKNSYGHPTDETLARLGAAGARVLRTDLDGTVTIRVEDGAHARITTGKAAF